MTAELFAPAGGPVSVVEPVYDVIHLRPGSFLMLILFMLIGSCLQECKDEYNTMCHTEHKDECEDEYIDSCQTSSKQECTTDYSTDCSTKHTKSCTD